MATSHNRRCWNTFYIYEEDLTWVWSLCSAPIIMDSMIPAVEGTETQYIYEDDLTWVWSICSASMIQVRLLVILLLLLLPASILLWLWDQPYQDGVASSWYIAAVAGDETHADMSMMCVRCPNHNLPYSMIQVWPRDSPTTAAIKTVLWDQADTG
jgi:hypothetical protein